MFNTLSEAEKYIDSNDIQMIDLKFIDLIGRWHHVTITRNEFNEDLISEGIGFDGSSVGLKSVKSGDMALIPDLATGVIDPFWETPTLSFICNTVEADSKVLFQDGPRYIASRAEKYMVDSKIATKSLWGPEFEFYILERITFTNKSYHASYRMDSSEGMWNSNSPDDHNTIPTHGGYHALPPRDHHYQLRSEMISALKDLQIPIKYHHHEVGAPGQSEIETPMLPLLLAADAIMMIKYVSKMVASQHGKHVTYLPKPFFDEAGSGMHFHIQLFNDKTNLFYDADADDLLSQTALFFIGGLLTHAPAVLAFTNPTTNSYRRLVPGHEAPVNCFFSSGNRSAAIRVPKYATQPDKVRFEFRPPDGSSNPYLALAAMLMAGLDGIRNRIDPTKAGFGPINENIFSWSPEQRSKIKGLPCSLAEAMDALANDNAFLKENQVFSDNLIANWIQTKRDEDVLLSTRPHPYEIEMYHDI
ncbi:MAG: type I glutamate--ammonia ligase [Anaerolineaceae bacterium]|nr:type I glutamate--ammonia ligase [Anaerolineaceae bacterium]